MEVDSRYMKRALQLARGGEGNVSPNPMVGAVIVADGRIIGEGYHRRYGEGHAEVNAVASVAEADREALRRSTMYVTLEPCSHYGKTPPCARLIIETGIPRVVVGCLDPFEKVSGRGVKMLRDAGVEVTTGVLEAECREINRRFMLAHTRLRPYVTLKWAQSADGYMDVKRGADAKAARFSTPLTQCMVHRLRAQNDAILVGSGTFIADRPRLDVRRWAGSDPVKVILDRRGRVKAADRDELHGRVIHFTSDERKDGSDNVSVVNISPDTDVDEVLRRLYAEGITSLLVEGGGTVLESFIGSGLWDEARIETAPFALGEKGSVRAPGMPAGRVTECFRTDGNVITVVKNDRTAVETAKNV